MVQIKHGRVLIEVSKEKVLVINKSAHSTSMALHLPEILSVLKEIQGVSLNMFEMLRGVSHACICQGTILTIWDK